MSHSFGPLVLLLVISSNHISLLLAAGVMPARVMDHLVGGLAPPIVSLGFELSTLNARFQPAFLLFPRARGTISRVINRKPPWYGGFLHQCRRFNTSSWRDAEKTQSLEKKSPWCLARSRYGSASLMTKIRGNGYPGSHQGEHQNGTAPTFDAARAGFEEAWAVFLSNRTKADFQAWRDARDWTARKYALWDAGKRLPPNEW
jgi:hypothetical protein